MLLGMPTEEEEIIKIEDEDNGAIVYGCMTAEKGEKEPVKPESCIKESGEDAGKESLCKFSGKKVKKILT